MDETISRVRTGEHLRPRLRVGTRISARIVRCLIHRVQAGKEQRQGDLFQNLQEKPVWNESQKTHRHYSCKWSFMEARTGDRSFCYFYTIVGHEKDEEVQRCECVFKFP
jgi:hypothetical protein